MRWPATRITNSSPKSFGIYEKALPLMERGVDIIHFEVGRPSFDTPSHIKQAAKIALDEGHVHYGDFSGELPLRQAISRRLAAHNGLDYDAQEIIVTNGVTHASFAIFMAALDPGDEVILLEPYYPQHINKIELAGGKVVTASLNKSKNFSIDPDAIASKITDRTRMICVVNPANPTGRVYSSDELVALADLAIKHDLLVLSDEVYEQIIFDDHQHTSIASLPGMRERTFSLFAFTKAYAMDGWRIGYLAAANKFIQDILKITMNDVAHVNTFIQEGARMALEGSQDEVEKMLAEDERRRNLMVERLNRMAGIECNLPDGTIYTFPNIGGLPWSAHDLSHQLLTEAHVAVEMGTFYGALGENHLRLCFGAEPIERIEEGLNRMEAFISRATDH